MVSEQTRKAIEARIAQGQNKTDIVYFYVCNHKDKTANQIAKDLEMPVSTVSSALDRLLKEEVVRYTLSARGLRAMRLWRSVPHTEWLTEEEKEFFQELKQKIAAKT